MEFNLFLFKFNNNVLIRIVLKMGKGIISLVHYKLKVFIKKPNLNRFCNYVVCLLSKIQIKVLYIK